MTTTRGADEVPFDLKVASELERQNTGQNRPHSASDLIAEAVPRAKVRVRHPTPPAGQQACTILPRDGLYMAVNITTLEGNTAAQLTN